MNVPRENIDLVLDRSFKEVFFDNNITGKTAILFSHSARIRCILNNFTIIFNGKSIDLMSFFSTLVSKDENKFENCACILIRKEGAEYYLYLIHDGGKTDTKRITNEKILKSLVASHDQPQGSDSIIGLRINPKQNKGIEECFKRYTNLLIVRHGKGWHNEHFILKRIDPGIFSKKWNSPLIKKGREQSEAAGGVIKNYLNTEDYNIFASVLRRTAETAFYFMRAFNIPPSEVMTPFFKRNPIYIIPCNDEVDDKSPEEYCNLSYNELNVCDGNGICQKKENRIGKESNIYRPPDVFKTQKLIEDIHYYVYSNILDSPCDKSVFNYLTTWDAVGLLEAKKAVGELGTFGKVAQGLYAAVVAGAARGGSLKKNKKKRRKTLRRKSKRFTKKRFTKKRFTKKRLTKKRLTNKKRFTKRR